MNIVLTNDDGIEAPGLQALFESVRAVVGSEARITVVAPDRCRSECGHSVTTGRPLGVREVRAGWYSIDGTPVDCVRVALGSLATDTDLVFSGVNAGANLGVDLLVSGTFAAAREAALLGVNAMAVSHYRRPEIPKTWQHAPRWLSTTVSDFVQRTSESTDSRLLWNVNLPALDPSEPAPPSIRCPVDRLPITRSIQAQGDAIEIQADFHARPRADGSDVERCFSGFLTISEIKPHV